MSSSMLDTTRERHVYIGAFKGQTPKKEYTFTRDQSSTDIPQASPARGRSKVAPKSILSSSHYGSAEGRGGDLPTGPFSSPTSSSYVSRPKTSRGKSRPSPDEFASYVVPSPPLKQPFDFTNGFSTELDVDNTMFIHTGNSGGSGSADAIALLTRQQQQQQQRGVDGDREALTSELVHFFQFLLDGN